ncbi:MAG: zf-HC2 domain-containing protein [Candidatus Brocadiia bacterium]
MNCEKTTKLLGAYLDGELGEGEAAQVREHLQACPRCAAELEELRRLDRSLGALTGMEAPAGFARRVRAAAERAREPVRLFGLPVARLRPVLARAAAVLVLAAGLSLGYIAGNAASHAVTVGTDEELSQYDLPADLLSAAPSGSVAELYLGLAEEPAEGGEDHVE